MDFHADFIDLNNKSGIGTYTGHVRLQQGASIITAPRAESIRGPDHKIAKAIAFGDKQTKARLETKSDPKQEKMVATANKLTYLAETQQVVEYAFYYSGDTRENKMQPCGFNDYSENPYLSC